MNHIIIFMMFLFLSYSINGYASPSFDCQKAKTNIEKTICQYKFLSDLDLALNILYKKACELSKNNFKIKVEQAAWLKNIESIDHGGCLIYPLLYSYSDRFLDLMKDQNLRYFFLKEFINDPLKNHSIISDFATIALWIETTGENHYPIFIGDFVSEPISIPITNKKAIIIFLLSRHANQGVCDVFKLHDTENEIKIELFDLPFDRKLLNFVTEDGKVTKVEEIKKYLNENVNLSIFK